MTMPSRRKEPRSNNDQVDDRQQTVVQHRGNQHKTSWTKEQDAALLRIVQDNGGAGRWRVVAEQLEEMLGYTGRGAKHCRERYFNHLDPNINHADWSPEESRILDEAYAKYGTAWSKIAKLLPGRTDNAVKNKWYSEARKKARKVSGSVSSSASSTPLSSPRSRKRCLRDHLVQLVHQSDDDASSRGGYRRSLRKRGSFNDDDSDSYTERKRMSFDDVEGEDEPSICSQYQEVKAISVSQPVQQPQQQALVSEKNEIDLLSLLMEIESTAQPCAPVSTLTVAPTVTLSSPKMIRPASFIDHRTITGPEDDFSKLFMFDITED